MFHTGLSRSFSTNSSLEIELTPVVSAMTGRRAALASLNPIERDRHAPLRGDHVGPPLQQRRRQPGRDLTGVSRQLRRGGRGGRGIAAEQELERANRLLASELELAQDVAIAADVGARHEDILLVADPDSRSVVGQAYQLLARADGVARRPDLQSRLGGEEPGPGDERRNRLSRVFEIRLRRRGLRRRSPPGRSAPGPRDRAPRSRRGRHPGGPTRRPTTCRRRARGGRPTATVSPRRASRGAAPARHARPPRADRRCARSASATAAVNCSSLNDASQLSDASPARRRLPPSTAGSVCSAGSACFGWPSHPAASSAHNPPRSPPPVRSASGAAMV